MLPTIAAQFADGVYIGGGFLLLVLVVLVLFLILR